MRYLGIDYGEKRIGIAVSDESGAMAFPRTVMVNKNVAKVVTDIAGLIKKENISMVVLGLPRSLQGKDTPQTLDVRRFADILKKRVAAPVEFENEMLTTKMAKSAGISKNRTDASAAALLLQSYLDRRNF